MATLAGLPGNRSKQAPLENEFISDCDGIYGCHYFKDNRYMVVIGAIYQFLSGTRGEGFQR